MTMLVVLPEDDADTELLRTTDIDRIAAELAGFGIDIARWATVELPESAGQDEVLAAYRSEVDKVCTEGGYPIVDVVRIRPDDSDPEWPAKAAKARDTFLAEHTHDENEVRFFVEGTGCFYLHLDHKVYAVVCSAGDLMSVPAGTPHWFDMGARPLFCAIRFFEEEDGWVAGFSGDGIASTMPSLDELRNPRLTDRS